MVFNYVSPPLYVLSLVHKVSNKEHSIFGTILPLFGCLAASATQGLYGEAIWNPRKSGASLYCTQALQMDKLEQSAYQLLSADCPTMD